MVSRLMFQKVFRNIFHNYISIFKNRELYKKSRETVVQNFEEWVNRLGTKLYHGGEEPDEADLEVKYGLT